jgi:uncharacterized protein YbjT (DUF2867 family)
MSLVKDKTVLISGGTGSLGKVLTRRLLNDQSNLPRKIIIFSRDEAKQHFMRVDYQQKTRVTDEIIYEDFRRLVEFPLRLPSDPTVTSDALALGLSSRWLGDRASFSPSAQQTCWSNDCQRSYRC